MSQLQDMGWISRMTILHPVYPATVENYYKNKIKSFSWTNRYPGWQQLQRLSGPNPEMCCALIFQNRKVWFLLLHKKCLVFCRIGLLMQFAQLWLLLCFFLHQRQQRVNLASASKPRAVFLIPCGSISFLPSHKQFCSWRLWGYSLSHHNFCFLERKV